MIVAEPQPEPLPPHIVGRHHDQITVYRFSLTAGPDFVLQLLPGARFASEPPGMFAGGRNLPLISASG